MAEPAVDVRVRMAGDVRDVRTARAVVSEALRGCSSRVDVDETLLLADELVSNAFRHGGGAVELTVQATETEVRVAVSDASPALPVLRDPGDNEEGGRGLQLVDHLAHAWGTRSQTGDGKTVWFEAGVE